MIDTTINMDRDVLASLAEAADDAGVSRTYLISCLMRRSGRRAGKLARAWEQVRYQARREKSQWKRIHIGLRGDEYEYFNDLKKVCKMSVSFIIAQSVELYLDEIVKLLHEGTDNYHYQNYVFTQYLIDDVQCWAFYWGIPPKLLELPA